MQLVLAYDSQRKKDDQILISQWCVIDEKKKIILQGSDNTAAEIAEQTKSYAVSPLILFTSPEIVVLQVERPPGSLSKIRQALPFLLEEQLVEDVEDLHFTIINQSDHATLTVAVIKRDVLQDCINLFMNVKLIPETVLPVWLAIPEPSAQSWRALIADNYLWLRITKFSGFSIEAQQAIPMLTPLLSLQPPASIEWISADTPDASLLKMCEEKNIQSSIVPITAPDTWITYIAKTFSEHVNVNLLHSEFSIKQQIMAQKRLWKIAGQYAAGIFAFWVVGMILQYGYFTLRVHILNSEIASIYSEIFPGKEMVGDPRATTEHELTRLESGEAGTDFLSLLLKVGKILQNFPRIHITEIVYTDNKLQLTVNADNFSRLRALNEEITNQGLPLQQENAASTGGVVHSVLKIG